MKCQILFSGKFKKNISKCRLLKILPRVLSVKALHEVAMPSQKHAEPLLWVAVITRGKRNDRNAQNISFFVSALL